MARRKRGAKAATAKEAPKKKDENSIVDESIDYEPLNGSWVAELEDAKAALTEALNTKPPASGEAAAASEGTSKGKKKGTGKEEGGAAVGGGTELLQLYLRLCRAYRMLRQWERLLAYAKKGLAECAATPSPLVESDFRKYKTQANAVLAMTSGLTHPVTLGTRTFDRREVQVGTFTDFDTNVLKTTMRDGLHQGLIVNGVVPDMFMDSHTMFGNSNSFQDACFQGDIRLVEEFISLGVAIDRPFREVPPGSPILAKTTVIVVPQTASALVMACLVLAVADSTCDQWAYYRRGLAKPREFYDKVEEVATQLVRLGADLNRTLVLEGQFHKIWNLRELHGKTAFQIASMTKRRTLIELMAEHRELGPEGRAEVVHCRCGSRLPWKMCHVTGIGQPPHYITKGGRVHYRASPMSRCPCGLVPKVYYRCCWRDNAKPTYLDDKTGLHFGTYFNSAKPAKDRVNFALDRNDPAHAEFLKEYYDGRDSMKESIKRIRESSEHFRQLVDSFGPKSNMKTWDRVVYAECLDRLVEPFYWKDVHWDLDKPELLRRAKLWNSVLEQFCFEAGLVGDVRARVLEVHTANPCAPCGYVGCSAMETTVREFQRCGQCKRIAYCGRACQKKDWAAHKQACREAAT